MSVKIGNVRIYTLNQLVAKLCEEYDLQQDEIDELTSTIGGISGDIETLEGNYTSLANRVTTLENKHLHVITCYKTDTYQFTFVIQTPKSTAYAQISDIYEDIAHVQAPAVGFVAGETPKYITSVDLILNDESYEESNLDGTDNGTASLVAPDLFYDQVF